jgi:hypothetical protein
MIVLDRSSGGVIAESVTGAAFSLNHVNALEHVGPEVVFGREALLERR